MPSDDPNPPRDLTAERAAKIVGIIDGLVYIDPNDYRKCEKAIRPIIRQIRQEALQEAANTVVGLMLDSQGQILDGDTLLLIHDTLDRLASEGG